MLFHWNYQPNGPLFVSLGVKEGGLVQLDLYVKHRDAYRHHNCFLNLKKVRVPRGVESLDAGICPLCNKEQLWFSYEDKYNLLRCRKCDYEAWSDKIYDQLDWYSGDDDWDCY